MSLKKVASHQGEYVRSLLRVVISFLSVFSTVCHGCPTVENFLFLYSEDGNPVDAKVRESSSHCLNFEVSACQLF